MVSNTEILFYDFPSPWALCFEKSNTPNCVYQYLIYLPIFLLIKVIYNCQSEHPIGMRQPGLLHRIAIIPVKSKKISERKPSLIWKQTLCFLPQQEEWRWESYTQDPLVFGSNLWWAESHRSRPHQMSTYYSLELVDMFGFMAKEN